MRAWLLTSKSAVLTITFALLIAVFGVASTGAYRIPEPLAACACRLAKSLPVTPITPSQKWCDIWFLFDADPAVQKVWGYEYFSGDPNCTTKTIFIAILLPLFAFFLTLTFFQKLALARLPRINQSEET
jgi:hypothetical protein